MRAHERFPPAIGMVAPLRIRTGCIASSRVPRQPASRGHESRTLPIRAAYERRAERIRTANPAQEGRAIKVDQRAWRVRRLRNERITHFASSTVLGATIHLATCIPVFDAWPPDQQIKVTPSFSKSRQPGLGSPMPVMPVSMSVHEGQERVGSLTNDDHHRLCRSRNGSGLDEVVDDDFDLFH